MDYYNILGVSKSADEKEIRSAFKKLALKYHPDRNKDDKEAERKFKEISGAYEVLKDKEKRARYDKFGKDGVKGGAGGFGGSNAGFGGFNDIFEEFFGDFGGSPFSNDKRKKQKAGTNLQYEIYITLEEAFHGKKENIEFSTSIECKQCHGKGAKNLEDVKNCHTCGGVGVTIEQQGFFRMERMCSQCAGVGKILKNPCPNCYGEGRSTGKKEIAAAIPKGVQSGTKLCIEGGGEAGVRGSKPGNLYILVNVSSHSFFDRKGDDLHCTVPIDMATAVLGGEFEMPTIDKTVARVKIKPGTQNGAQLRLKSRGMPSMRYGMNGDITVHVLVEIPVNLTEEQEELMKKFKSLTQKRSHPKSESFFERIKNLWS